ncbi:TATA box-binding protein-associated factor RNA polymerase I subunit B isoform X2 [Periplaneta americana]|uniref:TATA box-binding protein-associated factor RNA polymerase I subunit B isoform X2 n=1 Tax=Periplaneta americana TaxID=6978 RepID=UPI0037E72283
MEELIEEVHEIGPQDHVPSNARALKKPPVLKHTEIPNSFTSWEYYSFILKGLVNELINLGANPKINVVVLQLWTRYLRKLEVAFTSVTTSKSPKIGINFNPRDVKLVYGQERSVRQCKRKKRRKRRSSQGDVSVSSCSSDGYSDNDLLSMKRRRLNVSKNKLVRSDYEKQQSDESASEYFNETILNLDTSGLSKASSASESSVKSERIRYSSAARNLRKTLRERTYSTSKSNIGNFSVARTFLSTTKPEILCRLKLLAIIYLALLLTEDKIQLSDMMRWLDEGELSYHEVTHFFPEEIRLKGHDMTVFGRYTVQPSYVGVMIAAKEMAEYLDINYLPAPDLLSLARKYVNELNLPAETVENVKWLMSIAPPAMIYKKSMKYIPHYEGRVMAFIIVLLKLLLGLDGKTEDKVSKVSKKLNRLLENDPASDTRLFVWNDWVKYIECRKSVLAAFHFPTEVAQNPDKFSDPSAFIKFWEKMKTKDKFRQDRIILSQLHKMNPELTSALEYAFLKLEKNDSGRDNVLNFVPSLTPRKSHLETILQSKSSSLSSTVRNILNQDFTTTKLQHLIKPEEYIAMAEKKGINLVVKKKIAQRKVEGINVVKLQYQNNKKKVYEIVSKSENYVKETGKSKGSHKECNEDSELLEINEDCDIFENSKSQKLFHPSKIFYNLPLAAEKILMCCLKEQSESDARSLDEVIKEKYINEIKNKVTLYLPFQNYWLREVGMNTRRLNTEDFEREVLNELPFSFRWLLKECASILHVSVDTLYYEVLTVELMHSDILCGETKGVLNADLVKNIKLYW